MIKMPEDIRKLSDELISLGGDGFTDEFWNEVAQHRVQLDLHTEATNILSAEIVGAKIKKLFAELNDLRPGVYELENIFAAYRPTNKPIILDGSDCDNVIQFIQGEISLIKSKDVL